MIWFVFLIVTAVGITCGAAVAVLEGRVNQLQERVTDLEMGRPVTIEDGPKRLAGYRQDR